MANADSNLTPMLRHYLETKKIHPGYVLFYRLGDFYEMFFEDAVNISRELELTLTARAGTPMCGVPHHAAETYIQRLIKNGFRVALCEQLEQPDGKINREVVRLITPGTLTQDSMLDESANNYIMAFCAAGDCTGIACGDLSTGALFVDSAQDEQAIIEQIARFMPSEVLFNAEFLNFAKAGEFLREKMPAPCLAEVADASQFEPDLAYAESRIPGIAADSRVSGAALSALCALLRYAEYTQKTEAVRFELQDGGDNTTLQIGLTARRNLELTETMRSRDKRGTLLWVLDRTKTAMGKRRLRQLLQEPLANHLAVIRRLDAVEELTSNAPRLQEIQESLSGIHDLERLISRVLYKTANPRDLFALGTACGLIPALKGQLSDLASPLLTEINATADSLADATALVENAIIPNPPALTRDGGYINGGFNEELDRLRGLTGSGEKLLAEIEAREREATGIKNLKVGYNRVFGYYIELSKSNTAAAPEHYQRRQTLANAERYVTPELKKIEDDILTAKEKIIALESEILDEVQGFILESVERIRRTARAIAEIDVLCAFADVAIRENYCRPEITLDNVIDIRASRHPVVEKMQTTFTPNDCYLDAKTSRFMMITGPNMSGKSTFMRQIALIVIMAQMGSFVPAKSARLGITDKIYTRIGASDDLGAGHSTFMVEMLEVAEILRGATAQSFVVLDEIGRGTSTFDGISIAKAVAEHINAKIKCKTLFATHYHELIELEKTCPGINNFSVSVDRRASSQNGDDDGGITFLHKIVAGGCDQSFGIEVAKLAGLPDKVVAKARRVLRKMELNSKIELEESLQEQESANPQIDFALINRDNAVARIKAVDVEQMTPLDALAELAELKKLLG